ncbi:GNAT family N-acetyltransferase [Emcibacter sp. SYSU 3D8]|uniref:GNAT family N-acetyltransferase n=1 Tax=Emcibacter sp. SYSU 3D8 TaxID=3133969 RepID=UPI0031FF36F8
MAEDNYVIRTATRDEVDMIVDWAAKEGWNPGLRDAECFYTADPDGFLVGVLDGRIITAVSAVSYGASFAFMGFYICAPEHRGDGYGFKIANFGRDSLKARTIGLDGVVEQQDNYAEWGFTLAHPNYRYGGTPTGLGGPDDGVRPLTPADMHSVYAMDLACFGYERKSFLDAWVSAEGHRALGCFQGSRLDGFCVTRPCREGTKIAPLFAVSAEVAERLFDAAARHAAAPVFLDVPEPNEAAIALADRKGLTRVFETARMYSGPIPLLPLGEIYGITSFELG